MFNFQGAHILIKKCKAWMHWKSLWIKVSSKCINVNVCLLYLKIKHCFICILCVFVMCIFVLIFNKQRYNNDKDFYLPPLWSKYPPYFLIFSNLEIICLCNREIILAALLRQNSQINLTKNHEIVIFLKVGVGDMAKISYHYFEYIRNIYYNTLTALTLL